MSTPEGIPLLVGDPTSMPSSPTLLCPSCGCPNTHIDSVEMTTAAGQRLVLTAKGEDDYCVVEMLAGVTGSDPDQRRHTVILIGRCEDECGGFSVEFKQHKGMTYVSTP